MKFKMIIRLLGCFVLFVFMLSSIRGQEVIRLYETRAPGSAGPDMEEKITFPPTGEIMIISNVVNPSITVYLPDRKIATDTAVVLYP
jgi:hypothetical protein